MESTAEFLDLGRKVEAGEQIEVEGRSWLVDRVESPGLLDDHLGIVVATPAD